MRRILRDKFIELVHGEEGVAFVVTLGVFFFMYLIIAGVYAVGTSVKERIHLQNACDAAAYSAAVVQADTLSRIATINRAMSWTYVQMVKRQQDYIVWKWLNRAFDVYSKTDSPRAEWIGAELGERQNYLKLNENQEHYVKKDDLESKLNDFQPVDASFYDYMSDEGRERALTSQIDSDRKTLDAMYEANNDLRDRCKARCRDVAEAVAEVNLEWLWINARSYVFKVVQVEDAVNYLKSMDGNDEGRFVDFSRPNDWLTYEWFPVGNAIRRDYSQKERSLKAEWYWKEYDVLGNLTWSLCKISGVKCENVSDWHHHTLKADAVSDGYFNGHDARPFKLDAAYFGEDGAITVGIACKNENPWLSVLKTISGGLYSAFKPYCKKTVVFASAKAGYRTYGEGLTRGRNYKIDWRDEEDWNLYTSDWDAVLMPVRMAKTMATERSWKSAVGNFLGEWVELLGVKDDEMRAGGDDVPGTSVLDELFEEDGRLSSRRWYASQAKSGSHKRGLIQARWRVGRQGRTPDWDLLTDRMFH